MLCSGRRGIELEPVPRGEGGDEVDAFLCARSHLDIEASRLSSPDRLSGITRMRIVGQLPVCLLNSMLGSIVCTYTEDESIFYGNRPF